MTDNAVATRTETRDKPTIYPYKNFNALQDAQLLEQAMRGKGCDEEAVINILCNRTWRQRQEIAAAYERQYKKNLTSVLKSETSGDFEDVIVTLMQSPALNDAIMLKDAVQTKDHVILNTIAFTRKNEELREIHRLYAEKHRSNLNDDVKKATTGYYEQLLLLSLAGERDEGNAVSGRDAEGDARALWEAGPARPGTNMATFTTIFAHRNFSHLRQVFRHYEQVSKTSIEQTVIDEMKGDDEKGFLALVKIIKNDSEFFCDQIVAATKGAGTNEKKLNHIIASRAEIDLGTIADSYQRLHKQPLEKLIQAEAKGDYQRALLALVRGNAANADRGQAAGGAGHHAAANGQQHLPHSPGASVILPGTNNSNGSGPISVGHANETRDRPTVYPYKNFNALQDAQLLEQAMRGKGCDEEAVINILCGRTWRQRQEIAEAYKSQYKKDLTTVLKSETSGDFEDVIITLMQSPALNDAIMLKDAVKTKDHVILNTIAFTRKNEELREINRLYAGKHGTNLIEDVNNATTGHYEQLLRVSFAGEREQDNAGSRHDVEGDARALWEAGPGRPGTNMATYTDIFGRRSFAHLRQVFQVYQQVAKKSIEQTVIDEMKGDDEKGFLALIKLIKNDAEFFSDQIVAATKGLGTNEKKLNHIIVSRAEIDLASIADAYKRLHGQPLEKLVQSETSGDYQRALLALVRGNATQPDRGHGASGHYGATGGQQHLPDSTGRPLISAGGGGSYLVHGQGISVPEDGSVATRTETRDRPTVYPYKNFNALQDAQLLEQAMRGKGCDEEAVINILCARTWRQRQEIAAAYERQYKKNLTTVLKSETSGDFEDVIITLMQSPATNDAIMLKDAVKSKDHVMLNTIAFTRKNEELREIHHLYAIKHKSNLLDDVKKATTGYYEQLLLMSLAGERDQDNSGSRHDVEGDAQALWEAGPARPGTNMVTFATIFGRRSFAHLRQVFQVYQQVTKTTIEQTVVDEMKGDDEKGFLALIKVIKNDAEFFSDQIVAATKGMGTNEKKLNHIIVSRAEVDLGTIADAYQRLHGQPLEKLVQSETSGDYQRALLALVRGNASQPDRGHGGSGHYGATGGPQHQPHLPGASVISPGSGSGYTVVDESTVTTTTDNKDIATRTETRDRPTVYPYRNFNAIQDAQLLEQAMRGKGCDEEAVINILCGRTWRQRQEIAAAYDRQYKKNLTTVLKSETSGDFEDVIITLMQSPALNDAIMLKDAVKSKDHVMLNTIAFTRKNEELREIHRLYAEKHRSNLPDDVKKATQGYYEQLLLMSFAGERDQDNSGNRHDVQGDAQALWEAGPARPGTNMVTFATIFGRRSFAHLRQVFQVYQQVTKTTIEQTVIDEMKGDDEKGFLALIKVIKNDAEFFSDQLVAATKGLGTNEKKLNHIVVSRAETDLATIADAYQRLHGQPLEKLVQSETSGDYQRALLALVRGNAGGAGHSSATGGHLTGAPGNYGSSGSGFIPVGQSNFPNSGVTGQEMRGRPTVYPYRNFNALQDAQLLEQAMRGKGCDEEAVINILCGRTWRQRQEIAAAYQRQYQKNLTSVLKSETSGDFEDVIVTLMQPPAMNDAVNVTPEYFVDQLVSATKGLGTNETKLNHVIVSRAEIDLGTIADTYQRLHKQPLEKLVESETSGDYKRALLALVRGNAEGQGIGGAGHHTGTGGQLTGYPGTNNSYGIGSIPAGHGNATRGRPTVYPYRNFNALQDAQLLEQAMRGKGCDEEAVINILCGRTWRQRHEIAEAYKRQYKKDLTSVLKSETSGDFEDVIVTLMQSPAMNDGVNETPEFFVDQLVSATKGLGTNEKKLNHVIVSRAEIDLGTIADTYQRLHKQPLEKLVESETSGDYKRALLALVRGNAEGQGIGGAGHHTGTGGHLTGYPGTNNSYGVGSIPAGHGNATRGRPTVYPYRNFNALQDAQLLEQAMRGKGCDEEAVINILCGRTWRQRQEIAAAYDRQYKKNLTSVLKSETSGDFEDVIVTLMQPPAMNDGVNVTPEFFVDQLVSATKGLGTNEKKLNHVIVSRAEIDLGTIADTYQRLHKQPLEKLVESETSGDYKRALLALVRGNAEGQGIGGAGHYTGSQKIPPRGVNDSLLVGQGNSGLITDTSVVSKIETRDRPTVYPYRNFNALQDAQLLEQAMRGKGCDEAAVINILCARTWRQRQEIATAYERQYKKNLITVLKSETSGDFEDVIITLMQSPALNDAIMLKDAVKKKNHVILNTIAFTRKNEELREIRRLYAEKHGTNLLDDVTKATTGQYEQLLLHSLAGERDQDNTNNRYDVEDDARALWESGPARPGTNMATYVNIFARRSFAHLRHVFLRYQIQAKTSIEQTVIDEMKGDDEKGFLALIKVIKNDAEFFCDQLVAATKGLGTNEKNLNHVVVSRAEVDLGTIADTYQRLHKQPLEKLIESETSGDYKRALVALVRGNAEGQGTGAAGHYPGGQQHLHPSGGASVNNSLPGGQGVYLSEKVTQDTSVVTKMETRDRPTVYPYKNFNALQDAQLLDQAMRGKGCDEEAVINILCARTWRQRQEIATAYERQYKKNLIKVLKSETSGDFEDVIITLMQSPALNDAIMLKDAIKSKDHVILNTIAFTRKNEELREIHRLYNEKHGKNLMDAIKKATKGYYEQLLLLSFAGERDQDNTANRRDVEGDARALWEAGPGRPGTDMPTYVNIFARRSFAHLRQVFQVYQQVAKTSIDQTVIDEMKGDDEKGFLALIKVIKNDSEFFCDQLVSATKGIGTNEKKLNHTIVSRAEIDLGTIADTYQRLKGQPLEKLVESETSGDYKRALLALIRGNAGQSDRGQGVSEHYQGTDGQQRLPQGNTSVKVGSAPLGQFNPTTTVGAGHLKDLFATNLFDWKTEPHIDGRHEFRQPSVGQDNYGASTMAARDRPRIIPYRNFNANQDAQLLEQAMKGKGCDEEAVINILCNRTWRQRHEIAAAYKRQYGKDLVTVLKSETSGDFEDVILTLMNSPALNDAVMLKDAVKHKDHVILNTIVFTKGKEELAEIQRVYAEKYGSQLQHDVDKATSRYYAQVLMMSLRGEREPDNAGGRHGVEGDARALREAKPGTNMDKINTPTYAAYTSIFGTRSFPHLRQVFQAFQQGNKSTIEQTVKDLMKGDDEKGFLSLIKLIKTEPEFFVDQLVGATKGLGTNEKKLNYLIVSRAEIDLDNIADEYQRLKKQPLEKLVESETSGDYKRALLTLIHGNVDQATGTAGHYPGTTGQYPGTVGPYPGTVGPYPGTTGQYPGTTGQYPPGKNHYTSSTMDVGGRPRVFPYKNFNAMQDAQLLEQAMKGKGCDEEAVINILCSRTWRQRQEIATFYERQYKKNLVKVLKSETSGDFEEVIVTLMQSPALNDAIMLKDAVKKKDHALLNTIAFTRRPEELHEIHRLYHEKHGSQLQNDVKKATTGYYEQLLLLSLAGQRDQDNTGSRYDVEGDARALWEAGPGRLGTNMTTYTTIFGRRSFAHLRQVFQVYEQMAKTSIEQTVLDEMKGDDEKGFLALIKIIKNEPDRGFFTDQLVAATKGLGTNEKKLNYVIVSRAEIDLDNIADTYERLHKQPLEKLVESETSGDYKRALLTLLRGNAANANRGQYTDIQPNRGPSTAVNVGRPTYVGNMGAGSGSRPTANGNYSTARDMDFTDFPTVYPHQHFNHIRDAQMLERAMKGKGYDGQAVIDILCNRTWRQRQAIAGAYERQYRKQLLSVLKAETSGDFEDVILTLMQSPLLNDVMMLKEAIRKKDHVILNTIAFTKSNEELWELRRVYAEKHGTDLIEDVKKATTGYYEQLLVLSFAGERDHDSAGNAYDVLDDARALWEAGPARPGTNMATYVNIFARRSFVHLRKVFQSYQNQTKITIEKTVIDEMKGDDEKGFLALIKVIRNKAEFFVEQLVSATKGLGTNEKKLNYIIVNRAEIDLGRIRDEYQTSKKQPLEKLIESETSGDYKKCLLALVKGNAVSGRDFRADY